MNLDKWKSQIVRGTLEYCVLLCWETEPATAMRSCRNLERYPIISSTESTVYRSCAGCKRKLFAVDLAGI